MENTFKPYFICNLHRLTINSRWSLSSQFENSVVSKSVELPFFNFLVLDIHFPVVSHFQHTLFIKQRSFNLKMYTAEFEEMEDMSSNSVFLPAN